MRVLAHKRRTVAQRVGNIGLGVPFVRLTQLPPSPIDIIKVKGKWRYLYCAVDKQGQTVDSPLSENRGQAAAVRFFKKAIGNNEAPEKITLDGSRASH